MTQPRPLTILMLLSLLIWLLPAAATSVLPISLQRMTAAADLIFHGRAIAEEVKRDPASGRVVTLTTFAVIEIVKGETGEMHTIKQVGGHLPGSKVRQVIHGVPRFSTGQEYVVFLPRASSLGFSSPIGLSQGKFDVDRIDGQAVIRGRRAAAAVSQQPAQQPSPETPAAFISEQGERTAETVKLADFLQSVGAMIGQ